MPGPICMPGPIFNVSSSHAPAPEEAASVQPNQNLAHPGASVFSSVENTALELAACNDIPAGISGEKISVLLTAVRKISDSNIEEAVARADPVDRAIALEMKDGVRAVIYGEEHRSAEDLTTRTLCFELNQYLNQCGCRTVMERAQGTVRFLLDFLATCTQNPYTQPRYRWAANIFNVTLQTGLIVCINAVAREIIGFAIGSAVKGQPLLVKEVLGMSGLLLGMGLNLAGLGREIYNRNSTWKTISSRAGFTFLASAALLISFFATAEDGSESALSKMAGLAPQAAIYTLSRDLTQTFLELSTNLEPAISWKTALAGSAAYSSLFLMLSEASGHWFTDSGAAASQLNLLHVLAIGIFSALNDTVDELVRRGVTYLTAEPAASKDAVTALSFHLKAKLPAHGEVFDKLFTTCAFRTLAFQIITAATSVVSGPLMRTGLSDEARHVAVSSVGSLTLFLIYFPFMYGHARAEGETPLAIRDRLAQARTFANISNASEASLETGTIHL